MLYYLNEPIVQNSKKFNATLQNQVLKLVEKNALFTITIDVVDFSVIAIVSVASNIALPQKEIDKALIFAKKIIVKK